MGFELDHVSLISCRRQNLRSAVVRKNEVWTLKFLVGSNLKKYVSMYILSHLMLLQVPERQQRMGEPLTSPFGRL